MKKAHYVIFHPDYQRLKVKVQATVMVNQNLVQDWLGNIYVDRIGVGNEDPFVFHDPWIYSYCHASQLRRNFRKDSFIQAGSKLIFVSGQRANEGVLQIDTVFIVGSIHKWGKNPLTLPAKYQNHLDLWKRHFKFPFNGIHSRVSHTYEAELWEENKMSYSFLPLDENGERVSIPFDNFCPCLLAKIFKKVRGKYPILFEENEIDIIMIEIEKNVTTRVLKTITNGSYI